MAKYFKKRRISLRDIIFKPWKTSHEERIETVENENNIEEFICTKDSQSTTLDEHCLEKSGYDRDGSLTIDDLSDKEDEVYPAGVDVDDKSEENINFINDTLVACSSEDECNDPNGSDKHTGKSDLESENEFIMKKYFDSISLSGYDTTLSNERLSRIDTRSCSSLYSIPWSDSKMITSSQTSHEICPNKSPASKCSSTCTMILSRRKQLQLPKYETVSTSSNADSVSEVAELIAIGPVTEKHKSESERNENNNHDDINKLHLPFCDISQQETCLVEYANGNAVVSIKPLPAKSPVTLASPLHPPPNLSRCRSPTLPPKASPSRPHTANFSSSRPRSGHLLPLKVSMSNPNIHQLNGASDLNFSGRKPLPMLHAKAFSNFTRSNPSLYALPASNALSSFSSSSVDSFTDSTRQVATSPQTPTPPASPRPSSRRRRVLRVKMPAARIHDNFTGLCKDVIP